jgi:flavin-dependent dehydrogenase
MALQLPPEVDVAIVGAGTAGAAAAALCAEKGLRVVCVDRVPLSRAGAAWVNGVPAWAFGAARVAAPAGDELRSEPLPVHLVAGWGPRRIVIRDHGVLEVDMRLLVARLQRLARERGAVLAGDTQVRAVDERGLDTSRGRVAARWIVDASGLAGARLLAQPRVAATDLCAAAQEVRRVRDRGAAAAFCARHGVGEGEVLCHAGIAGGFSVLNVRVHDDTVSILTGSIPADGHPSGKAILDRFVAEQPWIGEAVFGGSRAIPLARPFDRLTDGRVILLGDAASQVFPAHGSGIGAHLVAARVLADALAARRGPWAYARAWMRRFGGLFASYDLFRRFSQRLTVAELDELMAHGLLDADTARFGMAQEHPRLALRTLPGKLGGLARSPGLGGRMAAVIARMLAVRALYARYPDAPEGLPAWSRAAQRIAG